MMLLPRKKIISHFGRGSNFFISTSSSRSISRRNNYFILKNSLFLSQHNNHHRYYSSSSSSSSSKIGKKIKTAVAVAAISATTSVSSTLLLQQQGMNNANKQGQHPRVNCPSYGCMLLPRDIFYDKSSQRALEQLRTGKDDSDDDDSAKTAAKVELFSSGDENMATLTLIGFKGGDPSHQINQDRAFCIAPYSITQGALENEECKLLGVFDGHARRGELVSEHSVQKVPSILAEKLKQNLGKATTTMTLEERTRRIQRCIDETFKEVDRTAPASPSGGCTASIILQVGRQLFVANAGDSRSFIAIHHRRRGETYVVYKSREDKPDLSCERTRIEKMGGRVYIPMSGTSRVMYLDSTTGTYSGLAMSRAIGDWDATGVIATPVIDVLDITELVQQSSVCDTATPATAGDDDDDDDVHIFAVSATDGMMDFVSMDVVANVMAPSLFSFNKGEDEKTSAEGSCNRDHPLTACERLIGLAANRWEYAKNGRYRDDIAIAVSKIRTPNNKKQN